MLPLTDINEALSRLESMTQSTTSPIPLTNGELLDLLDDAQRASLWIASTPYTVGQVVVPSVAKRMGSRFVCTVSGTSGSTEPSWGVFDPIWQSNRDATVGDGAVQWQEIGSDFGYVLWDLDAAAARGWVIKAGKVAHKFGFETDNQKFNLSDQQDHCLKMARSFASVGIA